MCVCVCVNFLCNYTLQFYFWWCWFYLTIIMYTISKNSFYYFVARSQARPVRRIYLRERNAVCRQIQSPHQKAILHTIFWVNRRVATSLGLSEVKIELRMVTRCRNCQLRSLPMSLWTQWTNQWSSTHIYCE